MASKVRMVSLDPIENAKVVEKPHVPSGAAEAAMFPGKGDQPKVEEKVPAEVEKPPLVEKPPEAPVLVSKHGSEKYEVLEAKIVSFSGHITYLPVGTIVSDESYGPGAIERLLDAKVNLKLVDSK